MGKKKQRADTKKPPVSSLPSSDITPCSLEVDSSSQGKSSSAVSLVDSGVEKTLPSVMDTTEGSAKLPNTPHPSLNHFRYNLSRSMFLRRSLHQYGHQLSRRNSGTHADTLSSFRKSASRLCDERLSFKLAGQCNSESGYHAEYREKGFHRPERIRSSPLVMDAISPDIVNMVCGICMKCLRWKLCSLGNTTSDLSVAAILVCGHVYHADCLEKRTSEEDRWDPSCPLCVDLRLKVDASREQE